LRMALDTWCHHEIDAVLGFRERGVLTRHHADILRTHADRLLNALRAEDIEGYRLEARRLRRPSVTLRASFWLYRYTRWKAPLTGAITDRMEHLMGELLLLRELLQQCELDAKRLFGKDVADDLHVLLNLRAETVNHEIEAIEQAYPNFAREMHRRHLALVALGLVEAEYRRHLSEATISDDVFEDLDAQRRGIAAQFAKRPELEFGFDPKLALDQFPIFSGLDESEMQALRDRIRPYLAFPGERLAIGRRGARSLFLIVSGRVEAESDAVALALGPGDFFGRDPFFEGCKAISAAMSGGYVTMLEIDRRHFDTLLKASPDLKGRMEEAAARPPVDPNPRRRQGRRRRAVEPSATPEAQ
jgi:CPA1 family monovalent cation:H+ antiporter